MQTTFEMPIAQPAHNQAMDHIYFQLVLPASKLDVDQLYNRVLPSQGSGKLLILTAGVCLAVTLEAVLRLVRSYALGWVEAALEYRSPRKTMHDTNLSCLGAAMPEII